MRKGIIYRELLLKKKKCTIGFFIYFAMIFIGVLLRMSMSFGNLAKLDDDTLKSLDAMTYYTFSLSTPVILALSFVGRGDITVSDYKTGWQKFSYTFPLSDNENAFYLTAISFCGFVFSLLISLISYFVFSAVCGHKPEIFVIKLIFLISSLLCINLIIEDIFVYIFKNVTIAQIVTSALTFLIIGAVTFFVIRTMNDFMDKVCLTADEINDNSQYLAEMNDYITSMVEEKFEMCVVILPLVAVAGFFAFYLFVLGTLKRREK